MTGGEKRSDDKSKFPSLLVKLVCHIPTALSYAFAHVLLGIMMEPNCDSGFIVDSFSELNLLILSCVSSQALLHVVGQHNVGSDLTHGPHGPH